MGRGSSIRTLRNRRCNDFSGASSRYHKDPFIASDCYGLDGKFVSFKSAIFNERCWNEIFITIQMFPVSFEIIRSPILRFNGSRCNSSSSSSSGTRDYYSNQAEIIRDEKGNKSDEGSEDSRVSLSADGVRGGEGHCGGWRASSRCSRTSSASGHARREYDRGSKRPRDRWVSNAMRSPIILVINLPLSPNVPSIDHLLN